MLNQAENISIGLKKIIDRKNYANLQQYFMI